MHERVAVNAVRSHVNFIMFRISDGSVSRVRACVRLSFHVGSLQPLRVSDTDTVLAHQDAHELHSRNGRAQKLGRARLLFIPGAGPVGRLSRINAALPSGITTAVALLGARPTDSFLLGICLGSLPRMGPDEGGAHAQGKISAHLEVYASKRWAGLYLVKSHALQSSLAEREPVSTTTSQRGLGCRQVESREQMRIAGAYRGG